MKNIGRFLWFKTAAAVIPITVSAVRISLLIEITLLIRITMWRIISLLVRVALLTIIPLLIRIPLLIIGTLLRSISLLIRIPLLIIALSAIITLLFRPCIWLLIELIVHIFPSGPSFYLVCQRILSGKPTFF